MKEHLILFKGDMIRAILDGRKTQTRRVVKPQPGVMPDLLPTGPGPIKSVLTIEESPGITRYMGSKNFTDEFCPYGKPGDRLWVRETIAKGPPQMDGRDSATYVADGKSTTLDTWTWKRDILPSIFMPYGLSRITLEVVSVRVERVQEITPPECEMEGIIGSTHASPVRGQPYDEYRNGDGLVYTEPRMAFKALWDSINAKRFEHIADERGKKTKRLLNYGWDKNPWVWVIEFKTITPEN